MTISNLQDQYLGEKSKKHKRIKIYMINGYQLKGIIKDIDTYTILIIKTDTKSEALIYKSAISTIEDM